MFESQVAGLLNKVLGEYVQNVSKDSLKLGVFKVCRGNALRINRHKRMSAASFAPSGIFPIRTNRAAWS